MGVTTDGKVADDLAIHSTDVSTDAVVNAAHAFLDGLSTKERRASVFDVDDDEWPAWSNVDGYRRALRSPRPASPCRTTRHDRAGVRRRARAS
ncbi:DUF3500 domain-containing protein [Streptomyces sp. NPDC050564]|uniref:DUF3500 domain-containing protein n=1 Tax=Streptomyces sp. NPDC050564 TaxID=3365631 RepID=UPI0037AF75B1